MEMVQRPVACAATAVALWASLGNAAPSSAPPRLSTASGPIRGVVRDEAVELLLNFNLASTPSGPRGQVTLLARDPARGAWEGDVDDHPLARGDVGTGRLRLRIGRNTLDGDDGLHVRATCRRRALEVALSLTPEVAPYLVPAVSLPGGAAVHWMVCPRLRASGTVRWGDRALRLRDAVAYHDHNWGRFRSDELQWEWGCSLAPPDASAPAPSVVVVRVLDGTRATVAQQGMIVWEGARRLQLFRGAEVQAETDGWLRARPGLRVPRALSLLAPGAPAGVPAVTRLRARSGGDDLAVDFTADDVARVLVPHETDLGTTVIHEVFGRMRVEGRCAGVARSHDVPAVFERLGSVT